MSSVRTGVRFANREGRGVEDWGYGGRSLVLTIRGVAEKVF
jgi:hypothetical protein